MLVKLLFLSVAGLLTFSSKTFAIDGAPISASFFGTFGIAKSNSDDVYFRSRTTSPRGADDNWFFENDSKLGVQLSYDPSEKLSATIQVLTELNSDDNYQPAIEWAYFTYRPVESLRLRIGRTTFPTFMASDYLNVDFAYLPLRMPQDVYSLVPFPGIDGIDVIFDTQLGKTYLQLQAVAAQRDFTIYNDGLGSTSYELRDEYGVRATLRHGDWSGSAGYSRGTMKVDAPGIQALSGLLISVADVFPEFGTLANELGDTGRLTISNIGVQYTGYQLSLLGEYVQRRWDVNKNVSDTDAYYLMAGYHFGKWTPYAFYSRSRNKSDLSLDVYPTTGPLAPVTAVLTEFFSPIMGDGSTKAIGLRFDLLENLAIKTQYEHIELGASLYLKKDGRPVPEQINLFSLALSFVY